MIKAGYRDLCFSLEGGPRYVKEVLNKPIDVMIAVDHLRDFRRASEELKIPIVLRAFFMVSGPGCKPEFMEESFKFAQLLVEKNLIDQVIPFIATPVPGSGFFLETVEAIRQIALSLKGSDKLRTLLYNGNMDKIHIWKEVLINGKLNDMYRFFEDNYIWARFRYGLPDLHVLYGMDPDYISNIAGRLNNLTSNISRIG
jgi:hypothetical protein